ncbi:DUF6088 family protein [Erysipelothrix rhusiopathiae]|nr:DUF6088 family protein [Erysipelothrix rhusiopathiae]MDE8143762.1 DUF6088 family protein [Erysipelothrix rhusiopathiae]MDE8287936.1 DUF6088 family protein [Erysipelothrix rhusiopathiae]
MNKEQLSDKVWNLIKQQQNGTIFSINEFYHLGNVNTIKSILFRLESDGKITRLIDGLYTIPKFSELLQEKSYPSVDQVANKLADKFSWTISPSENHALNLIGLSTQVPNKYVFVSDGPYRTYEYRGREIIFKHTSNRFITEYSRNYSLMIQAIKALGKDNIHENDIKRMATFSKQYIDDDIIDKGKKLPAWIQEVLKKIAKEVTVL